MTVLEQWLAHPGLREVAIQATADFMQAVADQEAAALRTVSVGPEETPQRCFPPSARPSGSFSPAAPPKPKRRAGRSPRTTSRALPVAEEAAQ